MTINQLIFRMGRKNFNIISYELIHLSSGSGQKFPEIVGSEPQIDPIGVRASIVTRLGGQSPC
jgi:hypothetical protein